MGDIFGVILLGLKLFLRFSGASEDQKKNLLKALMEFQSHIQGRSAIESSEAKKQIDSLKERDK